MTPELAELLERIATSGDDHPMGCSWRRIVNSYDAISMLPDLARRLVEAEARAERLERVLRAVKVVPLLKIKQRLGMIEANSTEEEKAYLEGGCLPLHEVMTEIDAMVADVLKPHACPKCGKPGCGCAGRAEVGAS